MAFVPSGYFSRISPEPIKPEFRHTYTFSSTGQSSMKDAGCKAAVSIWSSIQQAAADYIQLF